MNLIHWIILRTRSIHRIAVIVIRNYKLEERVSDDKTRIVDGGKVKETELHFRHVLQYSAPTEPTFVIACASIQFKF